MQRVYGVIIYNKSIANIFDKKYFNCVSSHLFLKLPSLSVVTSSIEK